MDKASRGCFVQSPKHCLVEKYIRVARLHQSMMERRLDGTGVYRNQHQILMFVSDSPNVSQKGLARMYGVSGATIAVSLKKLERGGYIKRLVDRENNWCDQICITDKGRRVVEDSVKIFRQMESRMLEGFSENDMKVLRQLLDRVYGNLDRESTDRAQREESWVKQYRKYIRPYLGAFILGPFLMLTGVAGEIVFPKLMSMIINSGVVRKSMQYILSMGGLMILTILIMAIGGVGSAYFSARAAVSFTSDLRDDLFSKVQEFSFKNIDSYSTGSPVTRLTNDIQQIQNVLMMGLRMAMHTPSMFIGALIMAFVMNARLTVVVLVVIPLLTAAIAVILRATFPKFTAMQKKLDQLNPGTQEALTNIRVIKSFVWEEFEEEKFRDMNQDLKNSSLDAMKIVIAAVPVMTPIMNITTLAVVWYGGNTITVGDVPVGDLTAFTTYIVQILMPLMILSVVFLQLSRAVVSVRRVDEIMDTEIDLTNRDASGKGLTILKGKVEFRHVSFSYMNNRDGMVLEDINLTAEPGQIMNIIGSMRSGKTTLVQMIPRLYDAIKSQVLVDGVDVRKYSLKSLRGGVSMVPQKNVLFSDTIEEDLRWSKEDASMDEVREVAQSTQTDNFVTSFTSGYDTDIGRGGVNVSGGQKQRLYIARALLKRPKVLIPDDSTSVMDTATEARIRQCFNTSLKDAIKTIIAQRIGSVEEAGRILVLGEGRLIGQGTHERPVEEYKTYQEIYYSRGDRKETAVS